MKNIKKDESGIAHLYLAILIIVVLAGVGFGVMRVVSVNSPNSAEVSQKTEDDAIDQAINDADKPADEQSDDKVEAGDQDEQVEE
ncbi:MAG: hypothetical protein AAB914_04335 [Patescibacteria group bacterium]